MGYAPRIDTYVKSEMEKMHVGDPPEPWVETTWRKIQKKIFPSTYREELRYNAQLWERYIQYVENEIILPMPSLPPRRNATSTGPR